MPLSIKNLYLESDMKLVELKEKCCKKNLAFTICKSTKAQNK